MELRRQILIQKLTYMQVYESRDGKLLSELSVGELELEYSRAQDRNEKK